MPRQKINLEKAKASHCGYKVPPAELRRVSATDVLCPKCKSSFLTSMSPLQFRDLQDPSGTFDQLFRTSLEAFLPSLAAAPWYVREREVVNLFVLQYLIPQFQERNLDFSQIGIEVPVLKLRENLDQPDSSGPVLATPQKEPRQALGKYGDIVVWPHTRATIWHTCRPLAHVEWKNTSCREKSPDKLLKQHQEDIRLLEHNRSLVCVSYAVLTTQQDRSVSVRCTRIVSGREPEDFFAAAPLGCAATCTEKEITDLQRSYKELLSRPQTSACEDCSKHSIAWSMRHEKRRDRL